MDYILDLNAESAKMFGINIYKEFNYLGVNITCSRNLVKEIKTQAQKAARMTGCLNDLVWRNRYIRKETK